MAAIHHLDISSDTTLENINDFIDTRLGINGASIYQYNEADTTIISCYFANNFADIDFPGTTAEELYGGAIYQSDGTMTISNSQFVNNQASDQGGAIYSEKGTLNISNCTFRGNKTLNSLHKGGAIYINGDATVYLTNVAFDGNQSGQGGAIFNRGNLIINGANFAQDSDTIVNTSKIIASGTITGVRSILGGGWIELNGASLNFNTGTYNCSSNIYAVGEETSTLSFDILNLDATTPMVIDGDSLLTITGNTLYGANLNTFSIKGTVINCEVIFGAHITSGDIDVSYTSEITLNKSTFAGGNIYCGNCYSNDEDIIYSNDGDIIISIDDCFISPGTAIYGGDCFQSSETTSTNANMSIDIYATHTEKSGSVYAGSYFDTDVSNSVATYETVTMEISGGHFGFAGNGSRVTAGNFSNQGDSSLTISGGTYDGIIFAGGYSMCGEENDGSAVVVNGNCSLIISGGTFGNDIFGGCGGNNYYSSLITMVTGNTTVEISGGTFKANTDIVGGSMGAGWVKGTTNVTIKGASIVFEGNNWISGGSQLDRYVRGERVDGSGSTHITAKRTLEFQEFTDTDNSFASNVNMWNGFDCVKILNGSNVNFGTKDQIDLRFATEWEFSEDSCLTWTDTHEGCNDFTEDKLTVSNVGTAGLDETATIFVGNELTLTGWTKLSEVNLLGERASKFRDSSNKVVAWTSTNYKLEAINNCLVVSRI